MDFTATRKAQNYTVSDNIDSSVHVWSLPSCSKLEICCAKYLLLLYQIKLHSLYWGFPRITTVAVKGAALQKKGTQQVVPLQQQ